MNKRITPKERGLLKGAIRRVFSRSDLRRKVIDTAKIEHSDPNRPRVRKWSRCQECNKPTPTYLMQVDHIDPVVPINKTLEEMSWDSVVDRVWCEEHNLAPICIDCHKLKSGLERKARIQYKKEKKKNG